MTRRPITRVVFRKTTIAVIRRGRVVYSDPSLVHIEAFLRGFDPELAARRARSETVAAEIEKVLAS